MSRFENLTDDALALLVQSADADAFVELSERYAGLIRTKAASFHTFALEAADLWQEGLLGLYQAATTYHAEREASFSTYAGVCISNRIITAYRVQCSRKNRILTESITDLLIRYQTVAKWDGKLPTVMSGGDNMLIDIPLTSDQPGE